MEEVNGGSGAGECFSGNSGETAALAADGDIKCLVTLLTELGDGNVLAHFNAGTDLYADLLHDVDFGLEDVLGKLVGRNAVAEHTAGLFVLFKHGGLVTHCGKVVCAAHAGGAAANNGNLFRPLLKDVGADVDLRHKAGFSIEVLFCDELLDGIDGDGLVYGSAGAGVLAAAVANAAAHCRERVFTLDELKGLREFAFGGLLEVTLDRNVGGAGCLAGGSTGFVAVDAVLVAVIFRPFLRPPLDGIRKLVLRILDGTAVGAKFLAKLHGAGGAILHAAAAGDALFLLHLSHIGASAHVGSVEELGSPEGVADLDVAVADGKDLSVAVDVRDLVDESVVLGFFEDGHAFVVGDIVAAAGFIEVFGHVSYADAPVVVVVGAAFIKELSADSAGADTHRQMAFIALEPVGNMLYVNGLVLHGNCLFHGNHVHADSAAAHGHHGGDLLQREESHALEEHAKFRMLFHEGLVHVGVFGASRDKHGNPVHAVLKLISGTGNRAVLGVFVPVVELHDAKLGHGVQKSIQGLVRRSEMLLGVEFM